MEQLQYVTLRQRPELKKEAAAWFHSKWGVPEEAYLACMDACLSGEAVYPPVKNGTEETSRPTACLFLCPNCEYFPAKRPRPLTKRRADGILALEKEECQQSAAASANAADRFG